jgi:predicted metal-binding protein
VGKIEGPPSYKWIETQNLSQDIEGLPIHESVFMRSKEVIFSDQVRSLCEQNRCGLFGTSWACPPAVGSVTACKKRCLKYKQAFMFTTVNDLKSQYDMEGWTLARKKHEKVTDAIVNVFRSYDKNLLVLSTEGCLLCKNCTYPDTPCKHPDRMYPAIEGYGIMVIQQARKSNMQYHNGVNTVTYFSMIFFNLNIPTA